MPHKFIYFFLLGYPGENRTGNPHHPHPHHPHRTPLPSPAAPKHSTPLPSPAPSNDEHQVTSTRSPLARDDERRSYRDLDAPQHHGGILAAAAATPVYTLLPPAAGTTNLAAAAGGDFGGQKINLFHQEPYFQLNFQ